MIRYCQTKMICGIQENPMFISFSKSHKRLEEAQLASNLLSLCLCQSVLLVDTAQLKGDKGGEMRG